MPVANFVHPFVESLSDKIVDTLVEGAEWIRSVVADPAVKIKGLEQIEAAMQHYKNTQLQRDLPMREFVALRK